MATGQLMYSVGAVLLVGMLVGLVMGLLQGNPKMSGAIAEFSGYLAVIAAAIMGRQHGFQIAEEAVIMTIFDDAADLCARPEGVTWPTA